MWREAFPGDDVCVTPGVRGQVRTDNAAAAARKVTAKLWVSKYTAARQNNGGDVGTSTSIDDIPRLQLNGNHYNFGPVKLYVRYNTGRLAWSGRVEAKAHTGHAGGSWGRKTGLFDCSRAGRPANGYAQAQDAISGRWSAKVPVTIGCAVL
nr:hypothetical protein GCM10020093_014850 [Planobispora longispora]